MYIEFVNNPQVVIDLDSEETNALVLAYQIMDKIQNVIDVDSSKTVILDNQCTGECFDTNELGRVKGIISGIINHNGTNWDLV